MTSGKILYFTDKFKVSQGYEPAFQKMLMKSGIKRNQVVLTDIYGLVEKPLHKKGTETLWRFNPESLPQLRAAFEQRVRVIKPSLIVVSCPAVLGVLVDGDERVGTLEKCRGGVYYHDGIPCVVTYPITAIHRNVDERLTKDAWGQNDEDEDSKYEPYKVPMGSWILANDWRKVGRFFHGKQRVIPEFYYSVVRTLDDAFAARDFLGRCVAIATDVETGLYPAQITCEGFTGIDTDGRVRTFVFPYSDSRNESGCFWDSADDHAIVWAVACEIRNNRALKIGQNLKYDCAYYIKYHGGIQNYLCDVMLVWYSMYMELPKSLDFISSILLDSYQYWKDDIKGLEDKDQSSGLGMERYWRYNGLDCYYTLFNWLYMQRFLVADKQLQFNYNDTFMRMLSGLRMGMRGVRADVARRREHSVGLAEEARIAEYRFQYLVADSEFNVGSPQQKCSLLYDVFGVRERNRRGRFVDPTKPKKGTNAPSAGAIPLKLIKSEHPLFRFVIEALNQAMEPRDQMNKLIGRWNPDTGLFDGGVFVPIDRFRTSFGAAGAETTRFNSKKSDFWDGGNAQNFRTKYKDWLVADPHNIFLDIDYSQSDDVFIGYESNDPDKIAVIESGMDGHAVHGELFFKKPYDEIVAGKKAKDPRIVHPITGIRQISKRIVHGCVPGDTEVWTRDGWCRIDSFVPGTEAMTWTPDGSMQWESADLYEGWHEGAMLGFTAQSAGLLMTPDHNMWCEERGRSTARDNVYRGRTTIPTSGFYAGSNLQVSQLQVALMADGSLEPSGMWRARFKKPRKIERFRQLLREADVEWNEGRQGAYVSFHVWGPDSRKKWTDELLEVPLEQRRQLIQESAHWDGDFHGNGIRFFTADKNQALAYERIAMSCGYSTKITQTTAGQDSFNPGGIMWVVGLTNKQTRGIRKDRWRTHRGWKGKIYCLLVPSKYFVVRYKGLVSITGNSNFQMAALTLYTTMGRDTVVAAAVILGFKDADSWEQARLVALCGSLMAAYRKKYKRLNRKEWYGEIEKQLKSFGLVKNAFGITRRFLGDPNDNGTQREATSFYGQSDTAGNMNRSMYEIDFGWIPAEFRDGPNPDANDTPRKMDWWSHGFRFMLQVHDSFLCQLDTRHPKWKEAVHNTLHVMNRPVIINGHTVRIKTEPEFGVRWGYGLSDFGWDGSDEGLDRIAATLLEQQKEYL